jgi:crossover junction endodeoxyribonuclease RuvC
MFVIGIDPGLTRCGYGVVETGLGTSRAPRLVTAGVLSSDAAWSVERRLGSLLSDLTELYDEFSPHGVAVERLFFQRNAKTAQGVSQASGVAIALASVRGCHVRQFTAQEVKLAVTGYGAASKEQVQAMVAQRLSLSELPTPFDAADALGLALTYDVVTSTEKICTALGVGVIGWLEGDVVDVRDLKMIVAVGGVGYLVVITPALRDAHPVGSRAALFIRSITRDDGTTLFGFASSADVALFDALLITPGVGPATAQAALATLGVEGLMHAIASEDVDAVATIPGVGKKTAARIILELSGKLPGLDATSDPDPIRSVPAVLHEALVGLGYTASEISRALDDVELPSDESAALRMALQRLRRS